MEIDIWIEVWIDFWCVWFQFVAIGLSVWAWIANTVFVLDANTETIVFEWHQIANITFTIANASANGDPVAFGQFELFDLEMDVKVELL